MPARIETRALTSFKKGAYLSLAALLLAGAFVVYQTLFLAARDYYVMLSPGLEGAGRNLNNCDMRLCIEQLAALPAPQGVLAVGACDLFMYSGGLAVAGFLVFLLTYFVFLVLAAALVAVVPANLKKPALLACSLAFLLVAMPVRPALWMLAFILLLHLIAGAVALGGRVRAALLMVAALIFYATVGCVIVESSATEYFSLSRLHWPAEFPQSSVLQNILKYLHLGQLNAARMHDEGFPFIFLALSLLLRCFRRILWLSHELWSGVLVRIRAADFFIYFLGMPALLGNSATPSYHYFESSHGKPPDALAGARGVAWCMGFCTLAYVAISMMAYSPAGRVLFPRCDVATVGAGAIWTRLAVLLVIDYLFLLSTEQASVGVARLFGYGLRDNFAQPLAARNVADFWRRWNIYWREFMVTAFFYPLALSLARFSGKSRGWHLALATAVTFAATFVLNVLPLMLLSGEGIYLFRPASPGPGLVEAGMPSLTTSWRQYVPSLTLYYLLEAVAVAFFLIVEQRRKPAEAPRNGMESRVRLALSMACTFAFVAAMRCFLDNSLTFAEQLRLLARAIGLGA